MNVRLHRSEDANYSRQLTELLQVYGFAVRDTELTQVRGGTLDVVASRDPMRLRAAVYAGLSDHHLLQWSVTAHRHLMYSNRCPWTAYDQTFDLHKSC